MYYNKFKDMNISALGFGGLRLPEQNGVPDSIDRIEAQKVIDKAVECGINLFDTAYTYQNGDSERFLGEALAKYPRDSYYLATKFYVAADTDIEKVFSEQLQRCRTDYFDFYMLHGVDENYIDAYMDEKNNYLGYLRKQQRQGRIKNIGFSSHATPKTLAKFLDWYDGFDMALIQLNYLDWTLMDAKRQYELLAEHGIHIWVMEPLKGGRLSTLNEESASLLQSAAPQRSLSSWGFRFLMNLDNVQVVLSGMSSVEQVADNAGTFSRREPLYAKETALLREATDMFRRDLGLPCSSCRYCCSSCPQELDIPLLLQGYNEWKVSGETWRLADLGNTKGAVECINCGACSKRCPQKIDIPTALREFADGSAGVRE